MKTALGIGTGLLLLSAAMAPLAVGADREAPAEEKPLVEIVKLLEKGGYAPICEISFDDGVWEVDAYKDDTSYEVTVDPTTGDVLSEHRDDREAKPPADAMLLSEIVRVLDEAGYTEVDEISFERRNWEVEAIRDNQKRELRVDPRTGEVVSDRVDD